MGKTAKPVKQKQPAKPKGKPRVCRWCKGSFAIAGQYRRRTYCCAECRRAGFAHNHHRHVLIRKQERLEKSLPIFPGFAKQQIVIPDPV